MRKYIIFIIIVLLIVAGIIIWTVFFKAPSQKQEQGAQAPPLVTQTPEVQTGFGEEVFDKVGENPVDKMPETNPFQKEINPLENVYKNPFE